MTNFIVTMSALILAVLSGYKLYRMSKYEFEHRTIGGIIEFSSYGAAKVHFALKGILRLVLVVLDYRSSVGNGQLTDRGRRGIAAAPPTKRRTS